MRKGISLFFGYDVGAENLPKLIKESGFDCVITSADKKFDEQNGTIRQQVRRIKRCGLQLSSLHMRYDPKELHYFWEEGKMGEILKKRLISDVQIAKKYGFTCVVVHLAGEWSEIGKQRLLDVLKVCRKLNVPLAIENTSKQKIFLDVFENIDDEYLRFCYDSGHNNAFDRDFDYLEKFGDKLITLHLHSNDGTWDAHTLNDFGNIDWQKLGRKLAKYKDNLFSLDYELLMKYGSDKFSAEECLIKAKKQADELEKIIENASAK